MWVPSPNEVKWLYKSGTGDMGDVLDSENPTARFAFPEDRLVVPIIFRMLFTAGSGTATMQLVLDHPERRNEDSIASPFDFVFAEFPTMGFDASGYKWGEWAPTVYEYQKYGIDPGGQLVVTWTDPGTTFWGLGLGYAFPP